MDHQIEIQKAAMQLVISLSSMQYNCNWWFLSLLCNTIAIGDFFSKASGTCDETLAPNCYLKKLDISGIVGIQAIINLFPLFYGASSWKIIYLSLVDAKIIESLHFY